MNDPKLTSSILDLSRNLDKLTTELRKNTSAVETFTKKNSESETASSKTSGSLKELGNLDFSSINDSLQKFEKKLGDLDFSSIQKKIEDIDLKSLGETFKNIKDKTKADLQNIGKIEGESPLKNLFSQSFKDLKQNILGNFEKGGTVNKTGNYVVGERGPEIVKLNKGEKVIPNKSKSDELADFMVKKELERRSKSSTGPTADQIAQEKSRLLAEDPDLANDPDELNYMIDEFVDSFSRGTPATFTREDVAKLTKPVTPAEASKILEKAPEKTPEKVEPEKEKKPSGFNKFVSNLGKKVGGFFEGIAGKKSKNEQESGNFGETEGLESPTKGGAIQSNPQNLKTNLPFLSKNESVISKLEIDKSKESKVLSSENSLKAISESLAKNLEPKISESAGAKSVTPKTSGGEPGSVTTTTGLESKQNNAAVSITKQDLDDIKSALLRISSQLDGPLSVAPLDFPFRPDSRRV